MTTRLRQLTSCIVMAGAALTTGAMTVQPLTAAQRAIVGHYTNNDPEWAVLRQARIGEDRSRGVFTADFPAAVKALAGRSFRISGFMSPLESSSNTRHFIVTRRSTTCPFCPPNEPTEAVEVELDAPARFTTEEVVVSGRLSLMASSDKGLFYTLSAASLSAGVSS